MHRYWYWYAACICTCNTDDVRVGARLSPRGTLYTAKMEGDGENLFNLKGIVSPRVSS
jgi:hypothetical protein